MDETTLLDRFSKYRIGSSEFLQIPIDKLIDSVSIYFKTKYQRNPTVQIPYHRCLYRQMLYDFFEKRIQGKKCSFLPYLDFTDPAQCLKRIDFIHDSNKIFELIINDLGLYNDRSENQLLMEFMKCFLLEFQPRDKILYLDNFHANGWNDFVIQCMREIYGYSCYKEMNRKEFLQKESFPERVILIHKSDEPLELVVEKIQWINCCFVIEDKNHYSIHNEGVLNYISFENIFYYLFYTL